MRTREEIEEGVVVKSSGWGSIQTESTEDRILEVLLDIRSLLTEKNS